MKIVFARLENLLGAVDFVTGDIILSLNQSRSSLLDTLKHELAHILVGNWQHSSKWCDRYRALGGVRSYHYQIFDLNTTHLADAGYAANIGNISGIQNIY